MYEPKFFLTHKLLNDLVAIEEQKTLVACKNLSRTSRTNLANNSKAINIFHLAHMLGIELTLKEAEKVVSGGIFRLEHPDSVLLNNFRNVIEFTKSSLQDPYLDIDISTMLHMNKILLSDWRETWDVKFRNSGEEIADSYDNWKTIVDYNIPSLKLQEELRNALDWYKINDRKIHPLIRTTVLIYRFIEISPLLHANKLTIIALADFLIAKNGYLDSSFLSITRHFDRHSTQYLELWRSYPRINADLTSWIELFISNLAQDFGELANRVDDLISSEQNTSKRPFLDLNKRQLKVLKYLQTIPFVKREDYVRMMDVSTMTAFRDLDDLTKKSLIKIEGRGRATRYTLATR